MTKRKLMTKAEMLVIETRISSVHIALSKERDKLVDIIEDAEALKETCERAIENLEAATDSLSELV